MIKQPVGTFLSVISEEAAIFKFKNAVAEMTALTQETGFLIYFEPADAVEMCIKVVNVTITYNLWI